MSGTTQLVRRPPLRPALLAEAVAVSTAVRICLHVRGVRKTTRFAARMAGAGAAGMTGVSAGEAMAPHITTAQRIGQLVQDVPVAVGRITKYRPFRFSCLPRSLTTWVLLRRRGIPVEWCVGVDGATEGFTSHAWVEWEGHPVGEDVSRFTPLLLEQFTTRSRR